MEISHVPHGCPTKWLVAYLCDKLCLRDKLFYSSKCISHTFATYLKSQSSHLQHTFNMATKVIVSYSCYSWMHHISNWIHDLQLSYFGHISFSDTRQTITSTFGHGLLRRDYAIGMGVSVLLARRFALLRVDDPHPALEEAPAAPFHQVVL